ncbi:MAG TPA: 7-carboxy-7-deazaguanine synthase [Smithella sp.]|nr:7-carboxy-7-deazaguanine synthase [Smithella sp.]
MSYLVKEIFYSLQGEGFHTGRPAVFCRFSGCNLWSGKESDRKKAVCRFCDTDFMGCDGEGGGRYATGRRLADKLESFWPRGKKTTTARPFVVLTGGEPLLQVDDSLVALLHERGWEVALETNGTIVPPDGIDWLCVSPKADAPLVVRAGQEMKLVFPQKGAEPKRYARMDFDCFFLQPLAGRYIKRNTALALQYVLAHPQWRLSIQIQKILKIK